MQEIFILRHGHAEDLNNTIHKNDFDRALTEEGKLKITKLSFFFNKLDENLDLILSSPLKRAKETAEFFLKNLDVKPEFKIVDFLSSGVSCKEIVKGLLPYNSLSKVLLIGHAPDLELFLGKLISANSVKLKKGAMAKVILDNGIELSGELEWLITPKLIKRFKLKSKEKQL